MKVKKWALGITSMVLGIIASIFAFVPMFGLRGTTGSTTITLDTFFGLFTKPHDSIVASLKLVKVDYSGVFKVIAAVLSIVVLLCVVAYIALFFADLKKNKLAELRKVLSFVLIILGVVIAICLIIFVATNSGTVGRTTSKIVGTNVFAAIAITLFTVLAGLAAYFAEKDFAKKSNAKSSKSKKK